MEGQLSTGPTPSSLSYFQICAVAFQDLELCLCLKGGKGWHFVRHRCLEENVNTYIESGRLKDTAEYSGYLQLLKKLFSLVFPLGPLFICRESII